MDLKSSREDSTLAWKIPWTEEPGGLQSMGSDKESDTTERLHFHFSLSCIGEGNGDPLQCSCLENPRDGGAWWAAVYGVAQSRTQLKRLSSSSREDRVQNASIPGFASPQGWETFYYTGFLEPACTSFVKTHYVYHFPAYQWLHVDSLNWAVQEHLYHGSQQTTNHGSSTPSSRQSLTTTVLSPH